MNTRRNRMFDTGEVIEAGFASSAKSEREIKL